MTDFTALVASEERVKVLEEARDKAWRTSGKTAKDQEWYNKHCPPRAVLGDTNEI